MLGKVAAAKTGANLLVLTPRDFAGLSDENAVRKKLYETVDLAESVSKSSGNVTVVQIDEVDGVFHAGTSSSKIFTTSSIFSVASIDSDFIRNLFTNYSIAGVGKSFSIAGGTESAADFEVFSTPVSIDSRLLDF